MDSGEECVCCEEKKLSFGMKGAGGYKLGFGSSSLDFSGALVDIFDNVKS